MTGLWSVSAKILCCQIQSFSEPQVKVYRVKGSLKNARKIGGLRGLYLHYCYKLGILPKGRKQNYARLLSLKGRPYEDGSHHTGNKAALPQSH